MKHPILIMLLTGIAASGLAVTGVWIANRLRMGSRANISRALFALQHEMDDARKELKQKMIQCAG